MKPYHLGATIRQKLQERQMTMKRLARTIGRPYDSLRRHVNGNSFPDLTELALIGQVLEEDLFLLLSRAYFGSHPIGRDNTPEAAKEQPSPPPPIANPDYITLSGTPEALRQWLGQSRDNGSENGERS